MPAEETIRSRANPLYRRLRVLREKGGDVCLIEGPTLALEALAAGLRVIEAVATPEAESAGAGREAVLALREGGVPVHRMASALLDALSDLGAPPGILAVTERPSFEDVRIFAGTPLVLLVEGVQNPGNLGALLRTAEAAGVTGAILTAGCADPLSSRSLRGSMGSAFRLPHLRADSVEPVLDLLEARGVTVLATAADGERRYDEADLRGPVALVVGSEGVGVSAAVRARAAARLRIPLARPVESLNVGVAAALVLFEAARQRGFDDTGHRP